MAHSCILTKPPLTSLYLQIDKLVSRYLQVFHLQKKYFFWISKSSENVFVSKWRQLQLLFHLCDGFLQLRDGLVKALVVQ